MAAYPLSARINRVLGAAATGVSLLLGVALMIAVVINVVNVIGRYGFNQPIEGADEVEIYLMVGLAFLGALVAHIRGRHLRMDVLARRFSPPVARLVNACRGAGGRRRLRADDLGVVQLHQPNLAPGQP